MTILFNIKNEEIKRNTEEAIDLISSMSLSRIEDEINKTEYLLSIEKDKDYITAYSLYLKELRTRKEDK